MLVCGPTGVGKSTLLGVVTGLVPRFSGGNLSGDVLLDGASVLHRAAARARPRRRLRRARTRPRGSSPTPWRRSWPTAWSSSACAPDDDAPPGRGDPRPARHRRPARPRPAHPLRRPAAAGGHRLGAHHAPPAAGARRADLRPGPHRRRGRARHPDPPGHRPRRLGAAGRAPPRAGGPVRRPDGAAATATVTARGRRTPPRCCSTPPSRRRSSSSAGPPGGSRCRSACARPAARARGLHLGHRPPPTPRPPAPPTSSLTADRRHRRARPHGRRARRRPRPARRAGHRADGPQRLRQVLAAVGAAGLRAARAGPRRPSPVATPPRWRPPSDARWSACCPRPPPTCSTSRPSTRSAAPAARAPARCWTGWCPASPATGTPATSPRASGSPSRSPWCWSPGPRAAARRAHPRPRLPRQAGLAADPADLAPEGARGARGHPRRRVRRPGRRARSS